MWGKQISQDGVFRCSCFVNNDYVTAEITYSIAHANHEVLLWIRSTFVTCAWSLSLVGLFATPWTVARLAPQSTGILQTRVLESIAMPSSRGSSQSRDQTSVCCIAGGFFTTELPEKCSHVGKFLISHSGTVPRQQESTWRMWDACLCHR